MKMNAVTVLLTVIMTTACAQPVVAETATQKTARILAACQAAHSDDKGVASCMIAAGEMSPLPKK